MAPVHPDSVYIPSPEIVAREIQGELIIVPLSSGVGDLEDDLYTLNETGRAVWDRLDGTASVSEVVAELASEFSAPNADIEKEVLGFLEELRRRRIVVEAAAS